MRKRLAVFLELINSERAEHVVLDGDHTEAIVKFLDAMVIKLEGGTDNDLMILDRPSTPTSERHRKGSSSTLLSPSRDDQEVSRQTTANSQRGAKEHTASQGASSGTKSDSVPEVAPVSPSSVPLPDAPPPPSASSKKAGEAKAKSKDQSTVKPISLLEHATPEQQQLQQQAQYYYQQQLYQQQHQEYYARLQEQQMQLADQSSQAAQSTTEAESTKKEETGKKKRKRRHREPYYYDAMDDESESESESDSEPEPAPPGEETSMEASTGKEELLPPGTEAEGSKPEEESLLPPGVDSPAIADANIQLPTSSSAKAVPSSDSSKETKPGEPAVDSSEPEPEPSNGVTEGSADSQQHQLDQPHTLPADSTQDTDSRAAQSTSTGEAQAEGAELPDQTADQPMDQVGSTDNAVVGVKKEEGNDVVSASSSEAEVKPKAAAAAAAAVVVEEASSQSAPEENKPASEPVAQAAEVDSNKLSEKKEVQEPESPVEAPTKKDKEKEVEVKEEDTTAAKTEDSEMKEVAEPRALHKTLSLFLKSVPPTISKEDITAVCKRFPGFLRVAFSDPSPERKFTRRGWITFDRSVNIKEISWDLNNTRIKDIEVTPVLNRDLNRRVRTVPGITMAKQIVRDDIKMAAKLIRELDSRMKLYEKKTKEDNEAKEKEVPAEKAEEGEEAEVKQPEEKEPDLPTSNPILMSLSEDAAEEEGGEEMELVGSSTTTPPDDGGEKSLLDLSLDENLMRVLDRLLLYLRVVHSLDYYNGGDYPYEDEMPNRCGIIHVRGALPDKATLTEAEEWQKGLKQKLEPHIHAKQSLPEEEVVQLGKKDPVAETEKFVEANTQELAKDKWLCPLSGKKFRGPEFVKKHIFNKHADKVEAVRMEAEFFNNYLSDPKRPQVPEPVATKLPGNPSPIGQMYGGSHPHGAQGMMGWGAPRPPMMMYGRGHYTPPSYGGYGHEAYGRGHTFPPKPRRFGFQAGRGRMSERGFHREARQIVQYRDLDAPEDVDVF